MVLKAVILSAGIGKRLRPLTTYIPKVLISIHGIPLLSIHLDKLKNLGVSEVFLVLGVEGSCWNSRSYKLIRRISDKYINKGMKLQVLFNEKNISTDSCYSFKKVISAIREEKTDLLIIDSDVVYMQRLLEKILDKKTDFSINLITKKVDTKHIKGARVILQDHKVKTIGKYVKLDASRDTYMYSGIALIDNDSYKEIRSNLMKTKVYDKYNLVVIYRLFAKKFGNVYATVDDGWININKIQDFIKAHEMVKPL